LNRIQELSATSKMKIASSYLRMKRGRDRGSKWTTNYPTHRGKR